jgi:glycosyltransferase involved in cell wall biosynthesis
VTAAVKPERAPRVIHVVESLDVGAVESWLLRMLRAGVASGAPLNWTFYSVLGRPGRHDEEARSLGATVINSPVELDRKLAFMNGLRTTLKAGRYDVLHSHHDVVSAVYLASAFGLTIRRRIVHVHNADLHVPTGSARKTALLREPMRQVCLRLADRIVGISKHTLTTFLNGRAPSAPRDEVLYYGIDTAPFHAPPPDAAALRRSLTLPSDARLMLFVGRMVSYKNPLFVVDILADIASAESSVYALFVGTGPLEEEVLRRAESRGVAERVRVLGWRDDIVSLMQASDVFVFPRAENGSEDVGMEGLGLVVVEAQAAGLPSLLSRGIPEDAIVLSDLCESLSLSAGSKAWGNAVRRILAKPRPDRASALAAIESSVFSLDAGLRGLTALDRI